MAYKWKGGYNLDDDLDLSSSSGDEIGSTFSFSTKQEDKLLSDGIQPGANEPIPSTSSSSMGKSTGEINGAVGSVDETKASTSGQQVSGSMAAQGREITFDGIQGEPLSSAEENSGKNGTSEEIDLDLDEICQQRNIFAPPRAPRRHDSHQFHHPGPITGARKKFYSTDPRQNLSLDEIIRMVPSSQHQTIKRRSHVTATANEGNWRAPSQQQQHVLKNEKLKQGLQSIINPHPNLGKEIFGNVSPNQESLENLESQVYMAGGSEIPEWTRDAWQCVMDMIHNGYSTYWSLMKLKHNDEKDEPLTKDQLSRLYRFNVRYNEVEGICEAANALLAKHGAAANFLAKMKAQFPPLGNLTMKVDEGLLLDPSFVRVLIDKLKEKYGRGLKYRFETERNRIYHHKLFKTTLFVRSSAYTGYSYLSDRTAQSLAGKMAWEKELPGLGPWPVQKIRVGMEECTTDLALYRGVESQMVHCVDFSRATMLGPEAVRATVPNGNRATTTSRNSGSQQRDGRDIHVSFVDPTTKEQAKTEEEHD